MIQINTQRPTKSDRRADGAVLVHSCFYTIQGEGPHVGKPAVFLRLAGCNLQCPGCDTEYSTGPLVDLGPMQADQVAQLVMATLGEQNKRLFPPLVVITGGEPFRQNILRVCEHLWSIGCKVQVESNGTLGPFSIEAEMRSYESMRYKMFEVVVSPKAGKVHRELFPFIIAYKYVLDAEHISDDGLPSSVLGLPAAPARPHDGYSGPIYVQPADEPGGWVGMGHEETTKSTLNQRAAIKSAMEFGYTLCIQTHKIIGLD